MPYDQGGPQTFDWQVYARIIEGIRAQVFRFTHPNLAIPRSNSEEDGAERFAHIEALVSWPAMPLQLT